MRLVLACLLLGSVVAAGCRTADERVPGAPPAAPTSIRQEARPIEPHWPSETVLAIPAGLPADGIDPRNAFTLHQDQVWVVGTGTVDRLLRDDTKAPRHQRFVVRLGAGPTVMIAHNIDIAPRVPFRRGDLVAFRGEYAWNEQGGVVHWTHRDRRDRKAGGWIVWKDQVFR